MSASAIPSKPTENFNPFVIYDAAASQKTNTLWHRVWQVAAIVSAIAFTALMTFAIVYTTIYFPMQLPIVSMVVFVGGLHSSFKAFEYLWDKHLSYQKEAKIDGKIVQLSGEAKANPALLDHVRAKISPLLTDEQKNALYARYQYYMNRYTKKYQYSPKGDVSKLSLKNLDFSNKKQTSLLNQYVKLEFIKNNLLQTAALDKVKAAYFVHLMERPNDRRLLDECVTHVNLPDMYRYVARMKNDPTPDLILQTENKKYTVSDILDKSTQKLADELFHNKFSWFGN